MTSNIVRLADLPTYRGDWSREDRALLGRAAGGLRGIGLRLDTGSGLTDEGEPWYVICHSASGDVLLHCARIGAAYVMSIPLLSISLTGPTLAVLVERCLAGLARPSGGPATTSPGRLLCGN